MNYKQKAFVCLLLIKQQITKTNKNNSFCVIKYSLFVFVLTRLYYLQRNLNFFESTIKRIMIKMVINNLFLILFNNFSYTLINESFINFKPKSLLTYSNKTFHFILKLKHKQFV